ncbi:MAG: reprolysin-like metallopeptidase [Bacteroidota bacterium]
MCTVRASCFRLRPLLAALLLLLTASPLALAQQAALWTDVSEAAIRAAERNIVPDAYRTVALDRTALADMLAEAPLEARPGDVSGGILFEFPMPDGSTETFRVVEAPVMASALQARYPQIRSYLGQGIDTPAAMLRFSVTPLGFNALVLRPGGSVYIDPYQRGDIDHYVSYYRRDNAPDVERVRAAFMNEIVEHDDEEEDEPLRGGDMFQHGETFRTYRIAIAATGEYTARVSQLNDVPTSVEAGLAAQVVAMTRVNGLYEREIAVRMEIIPENEDIIYTNGATDPYSNNNSFALLDENQANLTAVIGAENYDIGHVFSTGGGGVASLGSVCVESQKARGVTGLPTPIGDPFYVDFVAHEIGHQFRGNHTFNGLNGNCSGGNRNGSTAYEPGSGSTIMAYAGICGVDNIQINSDDYFHVVSLIEMTNFITTGAGSTCAAEEPSANEPPVVMPEGEGLAIPINVPFVLTGSATDDMPESLTYNWEEYDLGPASAPPGRSGWNESVPFFRSLPSTEEPVRYFPAGLDRVLSGSQVVGSRLPLQASSNGQRLRFRLTARDNAAGSGGIASMQIEMRAYDTGAEEDFEVTFANEDDLVFPAGPTEITWNVGGTDEGDVDTDQVDVLYSADGGETFDFLVTTDNDGSEVVSIPVGDTDEARIMIMGTGNVFFDVNDEEFEVRGVVSTEAQPEAAYALSTVYPNPVGAARATLNLAVDRSQNVQVAVYDLLGRQVLQLHDGPLAAGRSQQFSLDARSLADGVYLVRVVGETFSDVRELTVVR